jgi:hypothetical protein
MKGNQLNLMRSKPISKEIKFFFFFFLRKICGEIIIQLRWIFFLLVGGDCFINNAPTLDSSGIN